MLTAVQAVRFAARQLTLSLVTTPIGKLSVNVQCCNKNTSLWAHRQPSACRISLRFVKK